MARLLELLGNEVEAVARRPRGPRGGPRASGRDFVLLDIGLPGMDGYEVASALREDDARQGRRHHRRLRLRPGGGPAAVPRRGVRPPPGQARGLRLARPAHPSAGVGRARIDSEAISLRVSRTSLHARDGSTRRPRRRPSRPARERGPGRRNPPRPDGMGRYHRPGRRRYCRSNAISSSPSFSGTAMHGSGSRRPTGKTW